MTSHPRPSPRTAVSLLAAAALLVALVGCTPQDGVAAGYDSGVQTYESGTTRRRCARDHRALRRAWDVSRTT